MAPKCCYIAAKLILWPGRPREAKAVWIITISLFINGIAVQPKQEGTVKDGRRHASAPRIQRPTEFKGQ